MPDEKENGLSEPYVLDGQIGYKLRLANQKHLEIFTREMPEITPTQFSILVRLSEVGEVSQNHLGRLVHIDAATAKGVVNRLAKKGLVSTMPSKTDRRRLLISLTEKGADFSIQATERGKRITHLTTANLTQKEQKRLNALLGKL